MYFTAAWHILQIASDLSIFQPGKYIHSAITLFVVHNLLQNSLI